MSTFPRINRKGTLTKGLVRGAHFSDEGHNHTFTNNTNKTKTLPPEKK